MEARKVCLYSLVLALLLMLRAPAQAIIYVSKSGNDANDGLTWATSKLTILAGVNAAIAQPDKTVWVAVGTLPPPPLPAQPAPVPYVENVIVPAGVSVYGGFRGDEPESSPPSDRDLKTIVQPLIIANPIFEAHACTLIDGFIIENGKAPNGAGIFCTGGVCTVSNNIIRNNTGHLGAGIHAPDTTETTLYVRDCQFTGNRVTDSAGSQAAGASIYMIGGSLFVTGSSFENETARITTNEAATANGGAIYFVNGTLLRLDRSVFRNCICDGLMVSTLFAFGGAAYIVGATTYITNCLFSGCAAHGQRDPFCAYGGAIFFHNPGTLSAINNTFVNNAVTPNAGSITDADRAYGQGAALFLTGTGSIATIRNCIIAKSRGTAVVNEGLIVRFNHNLLWHNAGGDIYGFDFPVQNPPSSTDNNIMKDPQFLKGDPLYHITYGSPARDAGAKSGTICLDIDGEARPFNGLIDIGADEFVDTDGDGGADVDPRELDPLAVPPPEDDSDGDGVYDPFDNCPEHANPQQIDSNGDGIGDVCEGIPEVFYVDGSVPVSGDGLSWETAFKTIQEGIDAADLHNQTNADGASPWSGRNPYVWVKFGPYPENILIWHGVQVYGGFAGTEPPPALNPSWLAGRLPLSNVAEIDGIGLWSTVVMAHLPQSRYLSGATKAAYDLLVPTIDGFLINHGWAEIGGGVSVYKVPANISTNRINVNTATLGGGVYLYKSNGIVGDGIGPGPGNLLTGDTAIRGNLAIGPLSYAGYGGGIYIEKGSPLVFANAITGNSSRWGGGIAVRSAAPSFVQNLIGCLTAPNNANGTAGDDGRGGGVYLDRKSTAAFQMNTIVHNLAAGATGQGGGIWMDDSDFYMNLTINAFNTAAAGELIWANSPNAQVVNFPLCYITESDFYPITANSFFGIPDPTIGGPPPCALTNFAVDPLFVKPTLCNYSLQAASPLRLETGNVGAYQDVDPPVTIAEAKKLENGITVEISDAIVTAVFEDGFYIEDKERTSGIKVFMQSPAVTEGQAVTVTGVMTTLNDEQQIINAKVVAIAAAGTCIQPLMLSNKALGSGSGLTGVAKGTGLGNVGLLVKIWGRVKEKGASPRPYLVIDDGSGVGVKVLVPSAADLPEVGRFITVTGISGVESNSTGRRRLLRARRAADISIPQQ